MAGVFRKVVEKQPNRKVLEVEFTCTKRTLEEESMASRAYLI